MMAYELALLIRRLAVAGRYEAREAAVALAQEATVLIADRNSYVHALWSSEEVEGGAIEVHARLRDLLQKPQTTTLNYFNGSHLATLCERFEKFHAEAAAFLQVGLPQVADPPSRESGS